MTKKKIAPVHPGEVLRSWLEEDSLSANRLALSLRVPSNRILAILAGKRSITPETALRLARYFGTSAHLWLNLQLRFDLDAVEDSSAERVAREVMPRSAA